MSIKNFPLEEIQNAFRLNLGRNDMEIDEDKFSTPEKVRDYYLELCEHFAQQENEESASNSIEFLCLVEVWLIEKSLIEGNNDAVEKVFENIL